MSAYKYIRMPAKVGNKSYRFAGASVSFEHECSYPVAIVFDLTNVVSTVNAGW